MNLLQKAYLKKFSSYVSIDRNINLLHKVGLDEKIEKL